MSKVDILVETSLFGNYPLAVYRNSLSPFDSYFPEIVRYRY